LAHVYTDIHMSQTFSLKPRNQVDHLLGLIFVFKFHFVRCFPNSFLFSYNSCTWELHCDIYICAFDIS
jgi:hypothetical protein